MGYPKNGLNDEERELMELLRASFLITQSPSGAVQAVELLEKAWTDVAAAVLGSEKSQEYASEIEHEALRLALPAAEVSKKGRL